MTEEEWDWLISWCIVRARITRQRQRIYSCRIGGRWQYWSTAASAGYGQDSGEQVRREREWEAKVRRDA